MAKFIITGHRAGERKTFLYDNLTSELRHANGLPVQVEALEPREYAPATPLAGTRPSQPSGKSSPAVLKVQLGLSCNYSCDYCSQRFVPRADETSAKHVDGFLERVVQNVDLAKLKRVEFWGGEPFVYWKTLKPLAERMRELLPAVEFLIITNGSLLDLGKNEWIDRMGFVVGISHDGPGQPVRGPDPLEDADTRAAILDLYRRLRPHGRISFNAMMNRSNMSRAAVAAYFRAFTGDPDVPIGEGSFVDPYDEGGLDNSLSSDDEALRFQGLALREIRDGSAANFGIVHSRIAEIINAIANRRPASALRQKCGMDREDRLAVDLHGRVLTCQNVSAAALAPNGRSHHIGDITDIAGVQLDTSTHFAHRDECRKCLLLQQCKGTCMFLEGHLFDASCDNSYADHLPFFVAAFEYITGFTPVYVAGPQRADRHEIFGSTNLRNKNRPARRVIPIVAAA